MDRPHDTSDPGAPAVWELVHFVANEVLPACVEAHDGVPARWARRWCDELRAAVRHGEVGGAVDGLRAAVRAEMTAGTWGPDGRRAAWLLHRLAVDVEGALWLLAHDDGLGGRRATARTTCCGAAGEAATVLAGTELGLVCALVRRGAPLGTARATVRAAVS